MHKWLGYALIFLLVCFPSVRADNSNRLSENLLAQNEEPVSQNPANGAENNPSNDQAVQEMQPQPAAVGEELPDDTEAEVSETGEEPLSIMIRDIQIIGNSVIDTPTLLAKVEEYKNKELTLEEMGELADLITITYQEQGYILARAYLPEQEIEGGVLQIGVTEGKIGKIVVAGGRHFDQRVIKRYFKPQEKLGAVKESMLEQGLLLSNETHRLKTDIVLREGEKPGEVDIVVNAQDTSELTFGVDFSLDYNNFGSAVVSKDRYGIRMNILDHNWGSVLALRGVTGNTYEDSTLGTVDLTVPVGAWGTKVTVSYLTGNYVVGREFADLNFAGSTENYGFSVSHPIIKKKNMNLEVAAGYERKYSEQEQLGELAHINELNAYTISVSFDNLDRFLGKNFVSVAYSFGSISRDDEYTVSRDNASDNYQKLTVVAARIQKLFGYSSALVRGSFQYTPDRLMPSDQSIIGGYGTVRGHEPSAFLGDSGYSITGEFMFAPPYIAEKTIFGQRLAQLVQLALFVDHGGVFTNSAEEGESSSEFLTGFGAGVRVFYKDKFSIKYDIGFPLDQEDDAPSVFNYLTGQVSFF